MDFVSGYKGVVGRVFGNENSPSSEDSYVERLLDRINNGTKAEDRRLAMVEIQSVVAENQAAQLTFGAIGFPVIISVLKEERDDVEMVRGALETLVSSLTPLNHVKTSKIELEPTKMNADLLSREVENISLLLSLLAENDFYVRYYTLQVLTALLTNSPSRVQESILAIPRGITWLMDMMMDREVIRNEALLLLTYLTREAEEIQKIVVFEGAFEKIFSIIKEEGASDGGVVVQDCLELLNNILRNNPSNQILLRETVGFEPVISLLKLRGITYSFTHQKTVNLLSALETINLLITSGHQNDTGKDMNCNTNKTVLGQKNILDHLLMLGVESRWAPVAVRCVALRSIGTLISEHPKNANELANKVIGDEPQTEPSLNAILGLILRNSNFEEFVAADYVFRNFCEKNPDGQKMLVSTLVTASHSVTHLPPADDGNMLFGSMLFHGLIVSENDGDLQTCVRAASVLSHLLNDNIYCKERVLEIQLETPLQSVATMEPLMHRMMKYLALASSMDNKNEKSNSEWNEYVQHMILKLLIVWLIDCPNAVRCFLDGRPHLAYLLELVANQSASVYSRGLAAVLLGVCVLYNKCIESGKDAFAIVDAISQKSGLSSYFLKFDEMRKSSLLYSRKPAEQGQHLGVLEASDEENIVNNNKRNEEHPILASIFDASFVKLIDNLEAHIREKFVDVYSYPTTKVTVVPEELKRRGGESDEDYINRLKSFVEKQSSELQDLVGRNASLAEDLAKCGMNPDQRSTGPSERAQMEALRRELKEATQRLEMLKAEQSKFESEASTYRNLAGKMESDLKSLSDAYNSLEQTNFHLEKEVKALKCGGGMPCPDIELIKAEVREEVQKESEAELNDLLVCLGQEQSKVERLTVRLIELGEDVDELLEGIGDDTGIPDDDDAEFEDD